MRDNQHGVLGYAVYLSGEHEGTLLVFDPTPLLWALQDLNSWFYVGYRGGRLPHLAGWSELKQTFWNPDNQRRVYGFGFMGLY